MKTTKNAVLQEGLRINGGVLVGLTDHGKELKEIIIPDNVTRISSKAFSDCENLTSVTILNNIKYIPDYAFHNCTSLTSIIIPDSVATIGKYAFAGCKSLTNVIIPNSVTSIGESAFAFCESLKSVTIPNSVKSIGEHLFFNCKSLEKFIIPNSITSIEKGMFSGCVSLKAITIPNGITSLGEKAFYNCTSLTSITIPESLTSMGRYSFDQSSSLESVNYMGDVNDWVKIKHDFLYSNPLSIGAKLYINGELLTDANITTATKISTYAFESYKFLKSITIGDSVKIIEDYAIAWCSNVESITFKNPNGWQADSKKISNKKLIDTNTAKKLIDKYCGCTWVRK